MIEGYGSIYKLPDAAVQPPKNLEYNIIFSISKQAKKEGDPNPGLVHIARTINLYEWAEVPKENLHLVGIVHGEATSIVLNHQAFQDKFHRENPDLDLIYKLTQAGVELYICGQSLLGQGYERTQLEPHVDFALSALSVLPVYQLKGYAVLDY